MIYALFCSLSDYSLITSYCGDASVESVENIYTVNVF